MPMGQFRGDIGHNPFYVLVNLFDLLTKQLRCLHRCSPFCGCSLRESISPFVRMVVTTPPTMKTMWVCIFCYGLLPMCLGTFMRVPEAEVCGIAISSKRIKRRMRLGYRK